MYPIGAIITRLISVTCYSFQFLLACRIPVPFKFLSCWLNLASSFLQFAICSRFLVWSWDMSYVQNRNKVCIIQWLAGFYQKHTFFVECSRLFCQQDCRIKFLSSHIIYDAKLSRPDLVLCKSTKVFCIIMCFRHHTSWGHAIMFSNTGPFKHIRYLTKSYLDFFFLFGILIFNSYFFYWGNKVYSFHTG